MGSLEVTRSQAKWCASKLFYFFAITLLFSACSKSAGTDSSPSCFVDTEGLSSRVEAEPSFIIKALDSITLDCAGQNLAIDSVAVRLLKAKCYGQLGDYERCLTIITPLIKNRHLLRDSSVFEVHSQLGVNYFYLGAYERARREFLSALKLAHDLQRPEEVTRMHYNLFSCNKRLGELDSALSIYNRAINYARENELDSTIADFNIGLGIYYLDNEPIDSSFKYLRIGLSDRFSEHSDTYRNACLNLGLAFERTDKPDSARYYYKRAVGLAQQSGDRETEILAQHNLAYLSAGLENYQLAFSYLDSAVFLEDSINRIGIAERINALELKYKNLEHEKELESLRYEKDRAVQARNNFIFASLLLIAFGALLVQFLVNRNRANKRKHALRVEQLQREKEVDSLHTMLLTQEDERRRIAMDLHDGIGVILNTARLKLTRLERDIMDDTKRGVVHTAQEMLEKASSEVRRVSQNMMPGVLTKLGLADGLEDLADKVSDSDQVKVHYQHNIPNLRFHEDLEVTIYRIAQELLNNALKHSKASKIHLEVRYRNDFLSLHYRDNGVGFDQAKLDFKSTGLESIRTRVRFLEGNVKFDSAPGKGMSVSITSVKAPLEHE